MGSITYFNKSFQAVAGVYGNTIWPQARYSFLMPEERDRAAFNNRVDELMKDVKLPADSGRTHTKLRR